MNEKQIRKTIKGLLDEREENRAELVVLRAKVEDVEARVDAAVKDALDGARDMYAKGIEMLKLDHTLAVAQLDATIKEKDSALTITLAKLTKLEGDESLKALRRRLENKSRRIEELEKGGTVTITGDMIIEMLCAMDEEQLDQFVEIAGKVKAAKKPRELLAEPVVVEPAAAELARTIPKMTDSAVLVVEDPAKRGIQEALRAAMDANLLPEPVKG